MIVMKFGGSSVASATAIEWVAGIVKSRLADQPVVVVSAMGKTTDRLEEAVQHAARGSSYSAWCLFEELRRYHFQEARRLLGPSATGLLEKRIAPKFRDLHGLLIDLEEGRILTPGLKDVVLSYGEQLSSELVAAAFERSGMKTTHVNACDVIITDDRFTHATPLYWETYAKLRRTVAISARDSVVVMGGFIGATRDGRVTTLGRGGSNLTASLVGAGISANEIQIWTDVDGVLSCDPRVLHGGYRLRSLDYDEALEVARLGAKVLHPQTAAPAMRQGIPIVIRNSRHPGLEGTTVGPQATHTNGVVKSIACLMNVAVVHLFARPAGILRSISDGLSDLFERNQVRIHGVEAHDDGVRLAVDNLLQVAEVLRNLDSSIATAVEEDSVLVSLVGAGIRSAASVMERARAALGQVNIRMTSQGCSQTSISFAVPKLEVAILVERLHREFFREPDSEIFAATPESARRVPALSASTGNRSFPPRAPIELPAGSRSL
jgi:aspartate kinase